MLQVKNGKWQDFQGKQFSPFLNKMLCSQGFRIPLVVSHGISRSYHLHQKICISDGSSSRRNTHLVVRCLIDSLQSGEQEAISVPVSSESKVTHLESASNSDLVISVFKKYGLDDTQINDIISSKPKILTVNAYKTLEPKIRVFLELGLSGSDLVKLLKRHSTVVAYGLHTRIIPGIDFIRNLVGSNENVIKVINKSRWLQITTNAMRRISANVLSLQNYGLSNERIVEFIVTHPNGLMVKSEWFESRLHYVEEKLGISRCCRLFIHAMNVIVWYSESEIEKRIQIFRSFGWSDSEISSLLRTQPHCLSKSEDNVTKKLNFFMNELGYTPSYLISCNAFFTLSLEKRVKPRNKIFNMLKEKELLKRKASLINIVTYSELKFLEFLQSFETDIPGLCESYRNSVSKSKAE